MGKIIALVSFAVLVTIGFLPPAGASELAALATGGDAEKLEQFFRDECDTGKLTRSRYDALRMEIRMIESDDGRIAAAKAMWNARETMAWKVNVVGDVASAFFKAGRLDDLLSTLEKQANDATTPASQRARYALYLAILNRDLSRSESAAEWARRTVELAPLQDVDFWLASEHALGGLGVLDGDFIKRAAAEPKMPGGLRAEFIFRVRNYEQFDELIERWVAEKPDELADGLAHVYMYSDQVPRDILLRYVKELSAAELPPQSESLLGLLQSELLPIADDRPAAVRELWRCFELAGEAGEATEIGYVGWKWSPVLIPEDPEREREAQDREGLSVKRSFRRGMIDCRMVRLRCLGLIASLDGDGEATAKRLLADKHFAAASTSTRMAYLSAAELDRTMADELQICAKNTREEPAIVRLAALRYLRDQSRNGLGYELTWRVRVAEAAVELACGVFAEEPERIAQLVSLVHDEIGESIGMRGLVRAPLLELVKSWPADDPVADLEKADLIGKLTGVIEPPRRPALLDARISGDFLGESVQPIWPAPFLDYLSKYSDIQLPRSLHMRYLKERFPDKRPGSFQRPRSRIRHSWVTRLALVRLRTESQFVAYSRMDITDIERLTPDHQQRAHLARALLAMQDLKGDGIVERRREMLAELRERIASSGAGAELFELVAGQFFTEEGGADWETVTEIAEKFAGSENPNIRNHARHLQGMVAISEGRHADAEVIERENTSAFRGDSTRFGTYKSQMEPYVKSSPSPWLHWAERSLRSLEGDEKLAMAKRILQTLDPLLIHHELGRSTGGRQYHGALKVVSDAGELEKVREDLMAKAKAKDIPSAAVVFSTAGSSFFPDITKTEAAELMCLALPVNRTARLHLLKEALEENNLETALEHWEAAVKVVPSESTLMFLRDRVELSDENLLLIARTFAKQNKTYPDIDLEVGATLTAELILREGTREEGLRLMHSLFEARYISNGADRVVQRLRKGQAPLGVVKSFADQILWPACLVDVGLRLPGKPESLRQRSTNGRLLIGSELGLLRSMMHSAEARGELAPLHLQVRKVIDAGGGSESLHRFDFLASQQREPERVAGAFIRVHGSEKPVGLGGVRAGERLDSQDQDFVEKELRTILDTEARNEVLFKVTRKRGLNASGYLLFAAINAAEKSGDDDAAREFFEVAVKQAIDTNIGTRSAQIMQRLTREGDLKTARQLSDALVSHCVKSREGVFGSEGNVAIESLAFLPADNPDKIRTQISRLLDSTGGSLASRFGGMQTPDRLWDLAVRHGLEKKAVECLQLPRNAPDQSLVTIAKLAKGEAVAPEVFGWIVPDEDGVAILHWDMAARGETAYGAGVTRYRYPLDSIEQTFDLRVFEMSNKEEPHAVETFHGVRASGSRPLPMQASECTEIYLTTADGNPTGARPRASHIAGPNQLAGTLIVGGQPWDPCVRTSSQTQRVGPENISPFFPISAPIPLDIDTRVDFNTWLRGDTSGLPSTARFATRQYQIGFLHLDENRNPLGKQKFSPAINRQSKADGPWCFISLSHELDDIRKKNPTTDWVQLGIIWPVGNEHEGEATLTLGDPWLSISRGEGLFQEPVPALDPRLEKSAKVLVTQAVREPAGLQLGVPVAVGDQLHLHSPDGSVTEIQLESPARESFALSSDHSTIIICEDDSVWHFRSRKLKKLGKFTVASARGPSIVAASPSGRRLVRLIGTKGGTVVEAFKVTPGGCEPVFAKQLKDSGPVAQPTRLQFDPAGKLALNFGGAWIDLSFIDQSKTQRKKTPNFPELRLEWSGPEASLSGVKHGKTRFQIDHREGSEATSKRPVAVAVDAVIVDTEGDSVYTVENGWLRHWRGSAPPKK